MDNVKRAEAYHKSRLGQILVNRGYITEELLQEAVQQQDRTGQKLGEILLEQRNISRWQLRRALSNQTRLRFAASLAITLLTPLHKENDHNAQEQGELSQLLLPLVNSLTTTDGFQGLDYDPQQARADIRVDGSIRLRVTSSLGELQFDGIRIRKSADWDYEQLSGEGVDLANALLTVRGQY